ncbi:MULTISPECIES: ABC transporter ATP-binding protein [Alcaligenes]|uniref:ABC transporter ATP-binding protein n=1 Tax=Alcaligenes aquatilis TaxID=323284 RepID=A0ABY4NEY1_9BURK|nr:MULTISPECIES: ABC transporter ATP-binding protein [Alcaligenes]MCC9164194.1 ABC transporter ATP-binding protein [Alcaligenes sp. MMA]MCH4225284.1 ABC transporter ATP-binding protein [Alcaligenes faecalis]UQN35331.1 ABC transporter ATP-binding protein [Alcaligenes aquatilis]UYY86555.1 ABC transporter ATP-binding protein [Alcaligenes sp. SMD-FA]
MTPSSPVGHSSESGEQTVSVDPKAVPRLELRAITKAYPAVVANDNISLSILPGQIHAVLGENGAGKSTLMKIIYGVVKPDQGQILWDGQPVQISSPAAARQLGIGMVFQHFSLFDTLTVTENIALGLPASTNMQELAGRISETASQYGLDLDPQRHIHTLSVGECQRVEIVRALLGKPKLLILDEPTSVLTPQAVRRLFGTLRQLAAEGCSIVYISHKLDEIRELCHACTVMRMGKVTGYCDPREETTASLSRLMIGAEPQSLGERSMQQGGTLLQVRHLQLNKSHPFACELQDVSFDLHQGEILGVAGISGNGQQELLAALSGEDTRAQADMILLDGQAIGQRDAAWRRDQGMGFVPEERLGRGAVPELSLAQNLLLSHQNPETVKRGFLRFSSIRRLAGGIIKRFRVKTSNEQAAANSLSGGNLQKYIIGREVTRQPRILVIAQPTWGVDVGAAAQIHAELLALRDAGCALLVISEELDELFAIADRLIVISKGRMSPSIPVAQASVDQIGQWMSGLWEEGEHVQA